MTVIEGEILSRGARHPSAAKAPVIKVPKQNLDNRLSTMQVALLANLRSAGQPIGEKIGHLPRTGDMVDALGLPRDKKSYASISRSLDRLRKAGMVVAYSPSIATRGNGNHWAVKP